VHPTSATLGGQIANISGDLAPPFLIHTAKAGGRSASADRIQGYNQDSQSESEIGLVREADQEPVQAEGLDALPERLEKYARQTADSAAFGRWLGSQVGWKRYQPIGRRVACCGSHLVFHDYYRRDLVKLIAANNCCVALLCPFCAGRRAVRHLQNTIPKLRHVLAGDRKLTPYLLTITIRDEPGCRDMFQRIRALWSKCIAMRREARAGKRARCAWGKLEGGVMSFEVKRGSGSGLWHIHGHAVVVGREGLTNHEFQSAWSDLVGYWAQCDLRPLKSAAQLELAPESPVTDKAIAKDLMEVFKYALKFNAMDFPDRFQAFRDLQGERLVRAFGVFRGLKLEDEFFDDAVGLEAEPYLRLVYAAIGGAEKRKYVLRRSQRVLPGWEDGDEVVVDLVNMDVDFNTTDGDY
jgi:hypothetical protein